MWSDIYNYYNIQSDLSFSQKKSTKTVVDIILQTKYFKQNGNQNFSNADGFPWVDLVLVETKDGNFAVKEKEIPFINLIAIVCSKREGVDQTLYIKTFLEIAIALNWKLYLEEDDEGNENVEIRKKMFR